MSSIKTRNGNIEVDLAQAARMVKRMLRGLDLPNVAQLRVLRDDKNVDTSLDRAIDSYLHRVLPEILDVCIVSEDDELSVGQGSEYFWLIDPVDGTINALSGTRDWAISIALIARASMEPVLGVVHLPLQDELFVGITDKGAELNDMQLGLATQPSESLSYTTPIVSFGIPQDIAAVSSRMGDVLTSIMHRGWVTRQTGSAAVDICRVARGTWNAFFEYGLMYWDVAAAILIAREAGCHIVVSTDGKSVDDDDADLNVLVATSPSLGTQLQDITAIGNISEDHMR